MYSFSLASASSWSLLTLWSTTHHLIGKCIGFCSINDECTTGKGRITIIINGRLTTEFNVSTTDIDVSITIQYVCITLCDANFQCAPFDVDAEVICDKF